MGTFFLFLIYSRVNRWFYATETPITKVKGVNFIKKILPKLQLQRVNNRGIVLYSAQSFPKTTIQKEIYSIKIYPKLTMTTIKTVGNTIV